MARRRRRSSNCSNSSSTLSRQNTEQELLIVSDENKVRYAKRKKPQGWISISVQVFFVLLCVSVGLYKFYFFDHFHYHLTHFFAHHVEDKHAQHVLGHKLLKSRENESGAFHWFRRSSDQGHAHSAYNLAAGHLSGYRTDVKKGEVRTLLKFAAKNGVEEAKHLLRTLCKEKPKYCDIT